MTYVVSMNVHRSTIRHANLVFFRSVLVWAMYPVTLQKLQVPRPLGDRLQPSLDAPRCLRGEAPVLRHQLRRSAQVASL